MVKLISILASALAVTAASTGHHMRRQQVCNGNSAFCDRKYSNVSFIGTHNSAFVGSTDDPRVNQEKTLTEQLDAGIRFLQAQTHRFSGETDIMPTSSKLDNKLSDRDAEELDERDIVINELSMCHTSCALLYAGSLKDYLTTVKTWLDAHPNDVVTMLLTNGDNRPISEFDTVFKSAGIDTLAFVPPTTPKQLRMDQWPTYRELISSGKRLIVFLDYHADESTVPYILDEFTYFFETPFSTTDPKFPQCDLDRPKGGSPTNRMYIVNHDLNFELVPNVIVPDHAADYTTNAATGEGSIGAQADLCTGKWGRVPNFVLVDMFNRGDVFTAQNNLNGL